jgi:glycosyltransferase involved in cell wall biosynthesis
MANCFAGRIRTGVSDAVVIGTMRTGKNLPGLFRRSLGIVDHVVANSRDARDTLVRDHGISLGKISVVHNSLVFPASSAPRNELLRAQQGATATTTVLLCVAMFRPEKNQRELIEIVAALPKGFDWQLWLAGEGPALAACERLVAEKSLNDRVKFLGFQRDPSALYAAADIAVHASWSEALSNFLIEAQAHGLPAVAYEAQGITECFISGRTGWAIARDDRAAFRAELTRRMTASSEERVTLANEARAFAQQTFAPAAQVAAYLTLFSALHDKRVKR